MDAWPELSHEQAHAILMPYWQEVCGVFEMADLHEPKSIKKLVIDPSYHDTCRHFAATRMDGKVLYVAPQLAMMPVGTIRGVLAHEAGHVVDLQHPGMYWWRRGELHVAGSMPSKGRAKILRAWEARDDDEVERVADGIAEIVTGLKIGYVGSPSCLVQTLGRGIRRPDGLR